MDKTKAMKIVSDKIGNEYRIGLIKENQNYFVFMCEAMDQECVPSKIIVAVNKTSNKVGSSIMNVEEAIRLSE